ncbi:MAG: SRPBCC family protein [Chlamydiales bacterium]|nr:SRPBCC family protein [Chlamydiales bacterium]
MNIVKQVIIKAPIKAVYGLYADIRQWKEVMDDVIGVSIAYDDGCHQEFDMTVQRGSRQETVHSVRFCYPYSSIEIFQTKPPPLFTKMSGVWRFKEKQGSTLIEATRQFEVREGAPFDIAILEKFLESNLHSFKKRLENSCTQ